MSSRFAQRSKIAKNVLAAGIGVATLSGLFATPVPIPQPQQVSGIDSKEKPLVFDVASIKPNSGVGGGRGGGAGGNPPLSGGGGGALRFAPGKVSTPPMGVTARKMILEAFHISQYQLPGWPGWIDSDRFDVEAKAEGANEAQLRKMFQTLLAERFRLVVHRETKEMPVYALVTGKSGLKLHEWKEGDPIPEFGSGGHRNSFRDKGTMQRLADVLSGGPEAGRPVLDKTGLPGVYLFYVEWDDGEDLLPALQQQFGLKLEAQRGPVDIVVIDRIDKPAAN